ncbi:uncharacterized protein [Cherax quadricarinatus]|uniref:uncharacterized protein isoform X2 n=1 Tax=Cherax quadricarinatus TaxID=27406 RepID=UPI00387E54C3
MDYPQEVQDKLNHLRTYVPFVKRMIAKLEVRSKQVGTSHGQLERLHGLYGFLTRPIPRTPRMEMLEKMEAVIRSMHEKVQKAQGKPVVGSSPKLDATSCGPEQSHSGPEPNLSGAEPSHSRPELNYSRLESSSKPDSVLGHSLGSAQGGVGRPSSGHCMSPVQQRKPSPVQKSASGEWKTTRDIGGREIEKSKDLGHNERTREKSLEMSREGSYERSRGREFNRNESKYGDRSRERGSERSREKDHDRNRSKDFERKREHDFNRHKGRDRSTDRDGRIRPSGGKEYERSRDRGSSSRGREHEREKKQDCVRGNTSQERQLDRNRERETLRMERQHSYSEQEKRQLEAAKLSSKWNSLLDLPMPPSSSSNNTPHPFGDIENMTPPNPEKFKSSREKLQKLFGIVQNSSMPKEGEASTSSASSVSTSSRSRGWRDEVRARGDLFFTQRSSSQSAGEMTDDRGDYHPPRHRSQYDDKSSRSSHSQNVTRDHSHSQNSDSRDQAHPWKDSRSHPNNPHHVPLQMSPPLKENTSTPHEKPISPDQSLSYTYGSMDTPQSPDIEASFSPIISSEESTPVKTIPLENLQQKGVDLEAIKKALAQIRANERPSTNASNAEQGPSYRYEDFVGPASKLQADEDEPYDPEEVWNSQDIERAASRRLGVSVESSSVIQSQKDMDVWQVPTCIPLPHSYQNKMQDRQSPHPGHQMPHTKDGARTLDSGNGKMVSLSNIPLPQRQATTGPVCDKSSHVPHSHSDTSTHTVSHGVGWYQSISSTRANDSHSLRENANDVDMRQQQQQHLPPLPKSQQPPLPSSHQPPLPSPRPPSPSPQPPLPSPHQPPLPSLHQPPLPSQHQPPLPSSHQPPLPSPHQPPLPSTHQPPLPSSSQPPLLVSHQLPLPKAVPPTSSAALQPPLPKAHQPPLPTSFQPPLPKSPPPEPQPSTKPSSSQTLPSSKRTDELSVKDGHNYVVSRLDSIRSRIAHQASELIKPGQQGVAASQMEKYKLKRQASSLSEVKSPTYTPNINSRENISTKSESSTKGKDSVSVLDLLLPENKTNDAEMEEGAVSVRDPRQITPNISAQLHRDPRLKHHDSLSENESVPAVSRNRDPRLSAPSSAGGLSNFRDPRHQTNRDPRQESTNFSSTLGREGRDDSGKLFSVPCSSRDPRQDPGKFPLATGPQVRDPRHDSSSYVGSGTSTRDPRHDLSSFSSGSVRGSRDPRQEANIFPTVVGTQCRDPRMTSRGERPLLPANYPVQPSNLSVQAVDVHPSQSTSSTLIGQTFTCLMMRGLPPFTNSNHIYHFFQEYILRDMSIELDSHYQCKGTAYIHFPSHASAQEALELMNGRILQGYPVTLRICTVGILRQAKNAYEQLNRDREAQLRIPERPRGNGNPFFKSRPKEHTTKPPEPNSATAASVTNTDKTSLSSKPQEHEGDVGGNTNQYSELCGVKVPPKSSGKLSFKIPKIRKDTPKGEQKDAGGCDEIKSKVETSEKKKVTNEGVAADNKKVKSLEKDLSESDDELHDIQTVARRNRKFKKIVIHSDSESESEEKTKKSILSTKNGSLSTSSDKIDASNDDDEDDDDDESFMVIDETVVSDADETEESEVSSQVSEEPLDQVLPIKVKEKKGKKSKYNIGKQKGKKRSGVIKGKKKAQAKTDTSTRKVRGKKNTDKCTTDNVYKPEFNVHSSVGLKLTRHTQGELEELIPEKKKLKVLIPVPHKFVITLSDDDKLKKRGGKRKTSELLPPSEDVKKIVETPVENAVPLSKVSTLRKVTKTSKQNVIAVIETNEKDWDHTKDSDSSDEMFLPLNTKLNRVLKREVIIGSPTSKKGKKRKICHVANVMNVHQRKKVKKVLSNDDLNQIENIANNAASISKSPEEMQKGEVTKRGLISPNGETDRKKLRLDVQVSSSKSEGENTHQFDVFENDALSDEMPDLTQITPSLLDVDPTICNVLPNASALASVLSPPHASLQVSDVSSKSDLGDNWLPRKLQVMEERFSSDEATHAKMKEDKVLDEMFDMVIESGEVKCKVDAAVTEKISKANKGNENENDGHFTKYGESQDYAEINIASKESDSDSRETLVMAMETISEKLTDLNTEKMNDAMVSASPTSSTPDQQSTLDSEDGRHTKIDKCIKEQRSALPATDNSVNMQWSLDMQTIHTKSISPCDAGDKPRRELQALEDNSKMRDEQNEVSVIQDNHSEESTTVCESGKTTETITNIKNTEWETKTDENSGIIISNEDDDGDDAASVGKVSTSSFVDDASVVSSEGHDLKSPESQVSKKGKRSKSVGSVPSVECRRVTRGSVVEPLTAEVVEWDDGGVVDLFQCDMCDYFGRHMASHLVNFHTERELPCEFKKEDFPPVIKDHVGPAKEASKDVKKLLDLSWIPTNMNFEKSVTCKDCDYISNSRFDLIYHVLEHSPDAASSVYHCRLCNYMSEKKENFYNHVSSHTGEYRYRCELCGHRTYKLARLQSHHTECHRTQPEKFLILGMIEEDGWLYIHVCKVCMFVRIGLGAAEEHVKHRHGGKAEIHKSNMSRHIVLHSELRKSSGDSESTPIPRPKYKGKKKRRGKKGPDLEVFVGDEEFDEKGEVEEKAKQLVDRISINIHTTMSAQEAQKRMSLLDSISKKLDEDTQEDEGELCIKISTKAESSSISSLLPISGDTGDVLKENEGKAQDKNTVDKQKTDEPQNDAENEQTSVPEKESNSGENCNDDDVQKIIVSEDIDSAGSDSESTMSALDTDVFDDEIIATGKGFLQDTIRKLSAKLEEDAKKTKFVMKKQQQDKKNDLEQQQNQEKDQKQQQDQEKDPEQQQDQKKDQEQQQDQEKDQEKQQDQEKDQEQQQYPTAGDTCTSNIQEDSDSDNLVICEDDDVNDKDEASPLDHTQEAESSLDSNNTTEGNSGASLQDSIQLILREASTQNKPPLKMPKLRIRPAHQLMDPHHSPKQSKRKTKSAVFTCCVSHCNYSSSNNMNLIQHIIDTHGPYKCIASGCQFVTKSRPVFSVHLTNYHPKLNFLVCPFLCKNIFLHFTELIDHLSQHRSRTLNEDAQDIQPEEDSEIPGFLRIESVSTLDPTAASQMFGDDYDGTSSQSVSSSSQVKSLPKLVPLEQGLANNTSGATVINIGNTSISGPITSSMLESKTSLSVSGVSKSGTSASSNEKTPPVKIMSFPGSSHTGAVSLGNSDVSSDTIKITIHTSPQSSETKKSQPAVVTLDEEGTVMNPSQSDHRPPPGIATLPKIPPTVPVQSIFQAYQPIDVFKTLITKLAPEVFKCMHTGCIYADDDPEMFLQHISFHGESYRCCYCLMVMPAPEALVQHIITEHSHCQFQCKYCLYRAYTKIYMGVHLKNFHPYEEPRYIKVGTIQPHHPPNPPIDQFVRPYRCNYRECQYRTVDAEAFKTHVTTHGQFVILSCDFCHVYLHVIPLIDHMREHQMNEYQCPYCLHGDAEKERLLSHLLNCHPGRPGKVLLRKQITSVGGGTVPVNPDLVSRPPPSPDGSMKPERRGISKLDNKLTEKKNEDGISSSGLPLTGSEGYQAAALNTEGRRMSRSLSRELDWDEDGNSSFRSQSLGGEDSSSSQTTEKTDLSGHALYRCGNEGCEYTSISQVELREHLQVCDLAQDSTILKCYHCGKQCRHLSTLFEHLRVHGPKRYYCGVTSCDYRATMVHYFKNHMKQIHRCSGFKQLLKDPKNRDPETQEFVVYPKDAVPLIREGHRKRKNEYAIEDIHRIPRSHVSYHDLKCYYCQFSSKVRLNLIKHIQLHEKHPDGIPEKLYITNGNNSPIPVKQPVNPVPCLDRKELMFDKMMNLAGSSFECKKKKEDTDLRTKNPIPPEEYQKLPKFVPEERLHSCGIEGCQYLSCDDMMLKYHIRTLHADITSFPCPHCTDVSITVEKISSHFKLHGERLYRCGWCSYISYKRNVVERHMKEKHIAKKAFDFIIREPEDPDAPKKSEDGQVEEHVAYIPAPVPQEPQWQCGLCKFSSVTQQEMVNHTSLKHAIKSQFKCGYCSVRSSVRTSFDAHFAAKHPTQPFRVLCMYYRLDSEDIEPLHQGGTPHCHEPLWKRNDPERIRHIRGILIEDDPEWKRDWLKQTGTGKPDKDEFVCPRCGSFKTACLATFRSHLCREADYDRYQCVECGVCNALLPSLQRHFTKMHHAPFTSDCYLNLPVEDDKEAWVENVIIHQQHLIRVWQEKGCVEVSSESISSYTVGAQHAAPARASASTRRSLTNLTSDSASSEGSPQQGGVVLHDSGSERGRFVCDTCGSEFRSSAGLKSHTTAMHQARFKCHYCPFASNSEDAVKQHSSIKHPKLQNEVLNVSQRCKVYKGDEPVSSNDIKGENDWEKCKPAAVEGEDTVCTREETPQGKTLIKGAQVANLIGKVIHTTDLKNKVKSDVSEDITEEITPIEETPKSFSCPFCPFTISTASGLNQHKRSKHADTRLFMCSHCNGRFNTNLDALRHHRWKHQLLKPNITHLVCDKTNEDGVLGEGDTSPVESSEGSVSSVPIGSKLIKLCPGPKPIRSKARKSFTKPSSLISSQVQETATSELSTPGSQFSLPSASLESEVSYSCCHCNQRSNKATIDDHIKKQHRDLPYQVRKEEGDKIFTEVYIYKCIHCVAESISLAQAMDHWIQNHPLIDFKIKMVLRHHGEVSNQVVSSTTADKELPQATSEAAKCDSMAQDTDVSTSDSGISTATSTGVASSTVITSSSESSIINPLHIAKRRGSGKDMKSPSRYSVDTEEEETVEVCEIVDENESLVQSSSENETEDLIYKCGLCKKSSEKLEELKAHMKKIHADRPVKVKKLRREIFEQLFRAEYECGYCGERARHRPINQHHKSAHGILPLKITRLPAPPRENIYFRCDVCGHVVKNLSSIRQHLRRHHPNSEEFTFTKLALGSPMRPPIKQPFKCNYCGDVGETIQEMHTHHAFLHSHLECSITNLMDEALSSVHSPSTSQSSGEIKPPVFVPVPTPAISKSSPAQSGELSIPKTSVGIPVVPEIRHKNTARKSVPSSVKRTVAVKSTTKLQPTAANICDQSFSFYRVPQPPLQLENIYAFVNLGAGVPMRLTVQQLGRLFSLFPQVMLSKVESIKKTT